MYREVARSRNSVTCSRGFGVDVDQDAKHTQEVRKTLVEISGFIDECW